MNEIVKICSKHGQLTEKQISRRNRPSKTTNHIQLICKLCTQDSRIKWQLANPDKYKAQKKNKNKKYMTLTKSKENKKLNKLLRDFGITKEKYNNMIVNQNNVCAICKNIETSKHKTGIVKSLSVDHCHKTNKVRGLLCSKCNLAIGVFKDSVDILKSAIDYLLSFEDCDDQSKL